MKALQDLMAYVKERLKERDTQVVIAGGIYAAVRAVLPPHYVMVADVVAGLFGVGVMATPTKK